MPQAKTSLAELLHEIRRIEEHREVLTEKKIRKIYKQILKQLNGFLGEVYTKYANADGGLTVGDLQRYSRMAWFLEEIDKNCKLLPEVSREIQQVTQKVYEKCYIGMTEAVTEAYDLSIIGATPEVLTASMNNDIAKLTLSPLLEKHRKEIIYEIRQVINIGLMNGERYESMTRRLTEKLDISYGKANRIVRTEVHRNIETGFMDCAEQIQKGVEGSPYIYAATWCTMLDERVRPQTRTKTKHGWKHGISSNGANHQIMEGQTVKVGDLFDLGYYNGRRVTAKCPSQSGVAAHDCNCRCFVDYNLMTVEEFEAATGKSVYIASMPPTTKRLMNDNGITDLELQRTTDVEAFDAAIREMKKHGGAAACVDTHPIDEMKDFKLFLSSNGMAGVAVKPDGDITAVFKNEDYRVRGAVNDLIITARANGGVKMDCYGQFLVNSYEKCGYVPVAKIPFNPDYVDDPYLLATRPDVFVMMKNTDSIETVIKKNAERAYKTSSLADLDNLPVFEDYDEALKYRDSLLAAQ